MKVHDTNNGLEIVLSAAERKEVEEHAASIMAWISADDASATTGQKFSRKKMELKRKAEMPIDPLDDGAALQRRASRDQLAAIAEAEQELEEGQGAHERSLRS